MHDQMLSDLGQLSPKQNISLMIMMASDLHPILRSEVGSTPKFLANQESHEVWIDHVRRCLKGEVVDPMEVIAPYEMPDRPTFDALELEFEDTEYFGNLRLFGNFVAKSALYAGEIAFERAGIDELPQSLEEKFTDEELAESFAETHQNANAVMQEAFMSV